MYDVAFDRIAVFSLRLAFYRQTASGPWVPISKSSRQSLAVRSYIGRDRQPEAPLRHRLAAIAA